MEHVDLMHGVWGAVVTAFSFLGKKILNDYDEKIKRMEEREQNILERINDMNKMATDIHIKLTRIEAKLESKAERLLRRGENV